MFVQREQWKLRWKQRVKCLPYSLGSAIPWRNRYSLKFRSKCQGSKLLSKIVTNWRITCPLSQSCNYLLHWFLELAFLKGYRFALLLGKSFLGVGEGSLFPFKIAPCSRVPRVFSCLFPVKLSACHLPPTNHQSQRLIVSPFLKIVSCFLFPTILISLNSLVPQNPWKALNHKPFLDIFIVMS